MSAAGGGGATGALMGGGNSGGGAAMVGGTFFAARGPYGLNDVQGWGLCRGGGGGGCYIGTSVQNSFCESHTWRLVS